MLSENERQYYGEDAPEKIAADIYDGPMARLEYIGYWQAKYRSLEEKMRQIDDMEATAELTKDLKIIGQIYRKDMGEFLDYLSDANGKNFKQLYDDGFKDILKWINKES